jgi:hypothetical protein
MQATRAGQAGARGRARVCARRAAGWALGGYYSGLSPDQARPQENAYQSLRRAAEDGTLPTEVRQAAARLTTRLDQAFGLPFEDDPIDSAERILRWLWP